MPKKLNIDGTVKAKSPFADGRASGRALTIKQQKAEDARAAALVDSPVLEENNELLNVLRIYRSNGISAASNQAMLRIDDEMMSPEQKLRIRKARSAEHAD